MADRCEKGHPVEQANWGVCMVCHGEQARALVEMILKLPPPLPPAFLRQGDETRDD